MPSRIQELRREVVAERNRPNVPRTLSNPAVGARNNAVGLSNLFSTDQPSNPRGKTLRARDVVVPQESGTVLMGATPLAVGLEKRQVVGGIRGNKFEHARDSTTLATIPVGRGKAAAGALMFSASPSRIPVNSSSYTLAWERGPLSRAAASRRVRVLVPGRGTVRSRVHRHALTGIIVCCSVRL